MLFQRNKLKSIFISIGIISVMIFVIYITVNYLFIYIAPFLIAVIISSINEPAITFMENKMKCNRKLASLLSLALTVSVISVLIILCTVKVYYELLRLKDNLPYYIESISSTFSDCYNRVSVFYNNLPDSISLSFERNLTQLMPGLRDIIAKASSSVIAGITSLPKLAVFVTVTLLSSYFISSDRKKIRDFVYSQFPAGFKKDFIGIKGETFSAIAKYFKAQLILACITFIQTTLGLIIIKADYAVIMGLAAGIADTIPLLGTGLIMLPWIALNIITGNMQMALGICAVYLFGIITRQIIEPKIVSTQTGLHPLATLVSMYLGMMLIGFPGIFIGPIFAIFVKSLKKAGLVSLQSD